MAQLQRLKIERVVNNTPDTITISFEIPAHLKSTFNYEPGQYLTLEVPINNQKERRAYSMSSSPLTEANPAVTVKRLAGGLVSNYLNDHAQAGMEIEVLPPFGNFYASPGSKRNYPR